MPSQCSSVPAEPAVYLLALPCTAQTQQAAIKAGTAARRDGSGEYTAADHAAGGRKTCELPVLVIVQPHNC